MQREGAVGVKLDQQDGHGIMPRHGLRLGNAGQAAPAQHVPARPPGLPGLCMVLQQLKGEAGFLAWKATMSQSVAMQQESRAIEKMSG